MTRKSQGCYEAYAEGEVIQWNFEGMRGKSGVVLLETGESRMNDIVHFQDGLI